MESIKAQVHLNFSFREPFQSAHDVGAEIEKLLKTHANVVAKISEHSNYSILPETLLVEKLSSHRKGLIIVGDAQDLASNAEAIENIANISKLLGWPI